MVRVGPVPGRHALVLRVTGAPASALLQLTGEARRVFDLAADPALIGAALGPDPLLGPLVRRRPGLRIPGAWDAFECAVRAVLGQQVSVEAGRTLARRLVARAGEALPRPTEGLTHLFPSPAALAGADLAGLGLTSARARALEALARAVADGRLDLRAPADEVTAGLAALPGIGDWTAQYVALRALGEPDAFPAGDLVLRRSRRRRRGVSHRARARRAGRGLAALARLRGPPPLGCGRGVAPPSPETTPRRRVTMRYDEIESPVGPLLVAADDAGLRLIHFQSGPAPRRPDPAWRRDASAFRALARQLAEYFARERRAFELTLAPEGTPFQLATWRALTGIPYGTTISYVELARRVDGRRPPGRSGPRTAEPAPDRGALPPGHRQGRVADRLRRRARREAGAARARGRAVRRALRPSCPPGLSAWPERLA